METIMMAYNADALHFSRICWPGQCLMRHYTVTRVSVEYSQWLSVPHQTMFDVAYHVYVVAQAMRPRHLAETHTTTYWIVTVSRRKFA